MSWITKSLKRSQRPSQASLDPSLSKGKDADSDEGKGSSVDFDTYLPLPVKEKTIKEVAKGIWEDEKDE